MVLTAATVSGTRLSLLPYRHLVLPLNSFGLEDCAAGTPHFTYNSPTRAATMRLMQENDNEVESQTRPTRLLDLRRFKDPIHDFSTYP